VKWSALPREKAVCALCGSDSPILLKRSAGWPVSKCPVCGLIYLSERPTEASLASIYSNEYYDRAEVGYGGYVKNFGKYRGIFEGLFRARMKSLERFRGTGRLLELGCAHGFLLDHLRRHGYSVSGVEVSPVASGYARDVLELDVHTGSLESAGLPGGRLDIVLMLDVLEHLHRPGQVLREIGRILKPGGVLLVQCPWELTHWEEVMETFLRGRRTGRMDPDAVPAHLYFFSPRTLEAMLASGGFRVVRSESGNYGAVRRKVTPPAVNTGSPLERLFRLLYFRLGVQGILYGAARRVGWGNGLIRYARFEPGGG